MADQNQELSPWDCDYVHPDNCACIACRKDADTPDELTRWIWDKYVGVPVAGDAWGQEYENLLDRVRRMDRSSFTKGLHEGIRQMKEVSRSNG